MGEGNLDNRIFVGGLSLETTEKELEDAFKRCGKIIDCQIMIGRDTGRSRGFGFITFTDRRGADDAIKHMHGSDLGDRVISVNKAEPKVGGDDVDHSRKSSAGYSSRGTERYEEACFKCGHPGHWAQECPSASRGREYDGHRDSYGDRERYTDERRDGGRYNRDRYRFEDGYETRDHYPAERYSPPAECFNERYKFEDDYNRERYSRGTSDRYMGQSRDKGRTYRSRPGPYDRPSRSSARSSSYDRW